MEAREWPAETDFGTESAFLVDRCGDRVNGVEISRMGWRRGPGGWWEVGGREDT